MSEFQMYFDIEKKLKNKQNIQLTNDIYQQI